MSATVWHIDEFDRERLEREARGLHRQMSMRSAAAMLNVSPGQVARWRDGAPLTDSMARRIALSIVLRRLGMVGVFGRIDTRGARAWAEDSDGGMVAVRVMTTNDERGGA